MFQIVTMAIMKSPAMDQDAAETVNVVHKSEAMLIFLMVQYAIPASAYPKFMD